MVKVKIKIKIVPCHMMLVLPHGNNKWKEKEKHFVLKKYYLKIKEGDNLFFVCVYKNWYWNWENSEFILWLCVAIAIVLGSLMRAWKERQ